jgi:hypothetical protein
MRASTFALVALLACPLQAAHAEEAGGAGIVVTFADKSSLPLTSWSLSYEYEASREGSLPTTARRESRDLLVGKKDLPTAGGVLEISYREYERMSGGDEPQKETVGVVTGLVFIAGGKKSSLRVEAPHRDLLVPPASGKGLTIQARGLDLTGMTLTGAKRSFCLLAYAPQVECSPPASDRIVKIEFER